MDNKELDYIINSFIFSKIITKSSFIILVNDKRATLRSGKSVWSTLGHAKSALRNHIKSLRYSMIGMSLDGLYEYLIDNKIVEFKEVN